MSRKPRLSRLHNLSIGQYLTIIFLLFSASISALTTFALDRAASRQVFTDVRTRLEDIVSLAAQRIAARPIWRC